MKQRSYFMKLALTLILAFFANINLNATIRYVIAGSDNDNIGKGGLTWIDAYVGTAGLQSALAASASGDEIWVDGGEYILSSTLTIPVGVQLVGGYNTSNQRIKASSSEIGTKAIVYPWEFSNKTVLTSNEFSAGYVVSVEGLLDGVTVQNGVAGGVFIGNAATIRNCAVINNKMPSGEQRAAGIYYAKNTVTIESCLVANNELIDGFTGGYAADVAGGIGCTTHSGGGGIATINNSMILNNKSVNGPGGISFGRWGLSKVTNCVIAHNQTIATATGEQNSVSGGVSGYNTANTNGELINCTVAFNKISTDTIGSQSGGVSSVKMTNCVVYGNTAGLGNVVSDTTNLNTNINNSIDNTDPFFVKPNTNAGVITLTAALAADYSVLAKSSLNNAGNITDVTVTDIGGKPRIWNPAGKTGGVVDIGAYELQGKAERFVVYGGLTDVVIGGTIPETTPTTITADTRTPNSNWTVQFYSEKECDNVVTPTSDKKATYFVKAFDDSGHWNVANIGSFIVDKLVLLYINGKPEKECISGSKIVGSVTPSSANKFIEKLTYDPAVNYAPDVNKITETFGGKYEFTMPDNDVYISVHELLIPTTISYVSVTGSGDQNGYSWNNAAAGAAGLQSAITKTNVTEVRVASGSYTLTASLPIARGLIISGSYDAVTDAQDLTKKSKLVNSTGSTDATVGFFTLSTDNAGLNLNGFEISSTAPSTNPLFYITKAVTLGLDNINVNNYDAGSGALFNTTGVTATINVSNSTFSNIIGNWAAIYHGANNSSRSDLTFNACKFENLNTTVGGRFAFLRSKSLKLTNCIFNNITDSNVTAIANGISSSPDIINNTIVNCLNLNFGTGTITNTYIDRDMSGGTKTYCAWPGASGSNNINTQNLTNADIFTDVAKNNFTMIAKSPLINAGNNTDATATDFAGNPRIYYPENPNSGIVDIGAYEYQGAAEVEITYTNITNVDLGTTLDHRFTINDNRVIATDWSLKYYTDGDFNGEVNFSDIQQGLKIGVYYVRAEYKDKNYVAMNSTRFTIGNKPVINYVTENGAGNKSGHSWKNAAAGSAAIQSSLAENGVTDIWIAKGTYTETTKTGSAFTIPSGVKVYGGFAGDETVITDRTDIHGANKTILTKGGNADARIVLMTAGTASSLTMLDGVSVTGGVFTSGAPGTGTSVLGVGVYLNEFCLLNNSIVYENSLRGGAAVYVNDNSTVENSTIENNNSAGVNGGYANNTFGGLGVHLNGTNAKLLNSIVSSNSAGESSVTGGGVVLRGGEVAGCTIAKNNTGTGTRVGGGIIIHNGTIRDSLIYNNNASGDGGGIFVHEEKNEITAVKIINCTVYGNTGTTAGIVANGTTEIKNCVAFDNKSKSNGVLDQISGATATNITNCAYVGAVVDSNNNIDLTGVDVGNIFADAPGHDFSLVATSKLINAGDNTVIPTPTQPEILPPTDIAGKPRIWNRSNNGMVDIGAYEYQGVAKRQVIYTGVANVTTGGKIPDITIATSDDDKRNPASTWTVKFFSEQTNEPVENPALVAGTYYVKAVDSTGHWEAANTESFKVGKFFTLNINGSEKVYAAGDHVVGTVTPSSGNFIEKLTYDPAVNEKTETFGGKYEFTMPENHVKIVSSDSQIPTTIRYVSVSGSGDKNGYSWNNAAADEAGLQSTVAENGVKEVRVLGGEYTLTSTLTVPASVQLVGGYNTSNERIKPIVSEVGNGTIVYPWEFSNKTVLTSNEFSAGYVVSVEGLLDGVTVQNGAAGGISIGNAATIRNCAVINNKMPSGERRAAGIYYAKNTVTIENCLVANNEIVAGFTEGYAADVAGGIGGTTFAGKGGIATINNSMILNNKSVNGPGGISFGRSGLSKVTNCVIAHNETTASSTNENSSVSGAVSGYNSAASSYGELINCTVAYNKITIDPTGNQAGGISSVKMTNCVVYGNTAGSGNLVSDAKNLNTNINNSIDNIDPLFVNPNITAGAITLTAALAADYSVLAKSPLINAGNNTDVTATDFAGKPRIWNSVGKIGGVVDIGAYEYQNIAERFVVYDGLTDVTINEIIPTVSAITVTTDTRTPLSNWSVKYYSDQKCTTEVQPPFTIEATYFVKAFDDSGHWNVANIGSFNVSGKVYSLTINGTHIRNYVNGATIVGTVTPSSGKFVEKLTYNPAVNQKTETFGGEYNFTMPSSDVTIASTEEEITVIRYVSVMGSGDKNGYSWNNAAQANQLQVFLSDGKTKEVRMRGGEYSLTKTINIPAGKTLTGSFDSETQTLADNAKYAWEFKSPTILKGAAYGPIVTINNAILDAVTCQDSTTGAIDIKDHNSSVSRSVIQNNSRSGADYDGSAVGVAFYKYNATVDSCKFLNNAFTNNPQQSGAAISCSVTEGNFTVTVKNSFFIDNKGGANSAGAIGFGRNGVGLAENCVFINNAGGTEAAIIYRHFGAGSCATVKNSTIINNQSGSILFKVDLINSIVWGGNANGGVIITNASKSSVNNAIENSNAEYTTISLSSENNAVNGPNFVDPANNDFALKASSPLLDSSKDLDFTADSKDIIGNLRLQSANAKAGYGIADIGAYEYGPFFSLEAPIINEEKEGSIIFSPPEFKKKEAVIKFRYQISRDNEFTSIFKDGLTDNATDKKFTINNVISFTNNKLYLRICAVNIHDINISNWSPGANITLTSAQDVVVSHENGIFSWNVSAENGVARYEVVDQTGKVIATIVPNGDFNYQIEAEGDLRLVIIDVNGTRQTFHPDRNNVSTVSLNIEKGWNLIAVPFENADLKNLNRAVGHTYWSWNGEHYEVMQSELVPLEGFWVYSTKNQEITISGKRMASTERMLNVGWNLYGPTNNIAVPNVEAVFGWDVKNESNVEVEETLLQGRGYWFFTVEETVIKL